MLWAGARKRCRALSTDVSDIFITILKLCYGRQPVREVFAKLSSESGDVSGIFITILKLCYGRQPVREVFADDVCEANSQLTLR